MVVEMWDIRGHSSSSSLTTGLIIDDHVGRLVYTVVLLARSGPVNRDDVDSPILLEPSINIECYDDVICTYYTGTVGANRVHLPGSLFLVTFVTSQIIAVCRVNPFDARRLISVIQPNPRPSCNDNLGRVIGEVQTYDVLLQVKLVLSNLLIADHNYFGFIWDVNSSRPSS